MFTIPPLTDLVQKLGENNKIRQILRSTLVGPGIFLAQIKAKIPVLRGLKPIFLIRTHLMTAGISAIVIGLAFFNFSGVEKGGFIFSTGDLGGPEILEEKVDLISAASASGAPDQTGTALSSQDNQEADNGNPDFLGYLIVGNDSIAGYLSMMGSSAEYSSRTGLMIYEVKEGDNLAKIASAFGITPSTILSANDLKDGNSLQIGQKLVILPVSGVRHEVKSGDTVASLAKKYGVEAEKIITFNRLSGEGSLKVGDSLIIPDGKMPSTATRQTTPAVSRYVGLPNLVGYFIYPTVGWITQGLHFYNAVDIANKCGTPIYAAAAGIVEEALNSCASGGSKSCNHGYGETTLIDHPNGTKTRYAHQNQILVSAGDFVNQGQVIGYIGNTGNTRGSTGCHLHFEVYGAKNPLAR